MSKLREGRFVFLGTGGSTGVPVVACSCPVCISTSSFNKRLRPSALVHVAGKTFLIDVGPDFREQALRSGLKKIDAILLTHAHYDHIGGIDDLRAFYFHQNSPLPCLLSKETLSEIKTRYPYLTHPLKEKQSISVRLDFHVLPKEEGEIALQGVSLRYLSFFQAKTKVTGYRFGNLAYISDIRTFDEKIFSELQGLDVLILSALRETPSEMHLSVKEAVAFSRKAGAKMTYLTHIAHDLDHEAANLELPSDVRLGYDGQEIYFQT